MKEPFTEEQLSFRPANEASWAELEAVFDCADAGKCRCQRYKVEGWIWRDSTLEGRVAAQRRQSGCEDPGAEGTSGVVAYVDGEPAGWVAVEPRTAYPKLRTMPIPWKHRDSDRDDPGVWAVTCFVVRKGFRGRGLTYALARAALEHARANGATAVEGYGMQTEPGRTITWGELHVGARQVFEEAGFTEVTHPTKRRFVLRVDLDPST